MVSIGRSKEGFCKLWLLLLWEKFPSDRRGAEVPGAPGCCPLLLCHADALSKLENWTISENLGHLISKDKFLFTILFSEWTLTLFLFPRFIFNLHHLTVSLNYLIYPQHSSRFLPVDYFSVVTEVMSAHSHTTLQSSHWGFSHIRTWLQLPLMLASGT